ncbi:MAG TPA: hypothetical protein DD733_03265 [Clostridiales bacterium]|nr:hypothetical protein [Clostridiales bacterium]
MIYDVKGIELPYTEPREYDFIHVFSRPRHITAIFKQTIKPSGFLFFYFYIASKTAGQKSCGVPDFCFYI